MVESKSSVIPPGRRRRTPGPPRRRRAACGASRCGSRLRVAARVRREVAVGLPLVWLWGVGVEDAGGATSSRRTASIHDDEPYG